MSTTVVAGTDGVTPIYAPNERWTIWALADIFTGAAGTNKYVPKVNDYVIDYSTNEQYIVTGLDTTTMIATLKAITTAATATLSSNDLLSGVGPGTDSDTYRIYIDKSVLPYTLCVDQRLKIHGTAASKAVIYKGSLIDIANAKVISAVYDNANNYLGSSVGLELVSIDLASGTNYSTKQVLPCNTMESLNDGEVVTIVIYAADGSVCSKRQLLVENTAYIRKTSDSQKYITAISLESPFLSSSDPTLIQYPLNVPLSGLNLFGVVHYSDGTTLRMPVDNTKFEIFGLENFVATIIGQTIPLVLKYNLSPGEACYNVDTNNGAYITAKYTATTTKADGSYSVKLYPYPVWIDSINGYRLEWYLMTLDRNLLKKVTSYVSINSNSNAFNPVNYGVTQHLSASINLNDVDGTYKNFIHTQTVDITLYRKATDHSDTEWAIGFESGQSPLYGVKNFVESTFINQNLRSLDISLGETDQAAWLTRLYAASKPLYDPDKESAAPTPNMFSLIINDVETEYLISQWNGQLTTDQTVNDTQTIYVKFFKRVPSTDILLSVAGIPVIQIN